MPSIDDARRALLDVFGFSTLLDGQEAVIRRLLAGRSSAAIFPTGGGKSLCYQLPALLLDGLTVVVSPLIALMKDQVDFLARRGIAAARLDSSLDAAGARQVYSDLRAGKLKLLYVAPERLSGGRFVDTLAGRPIALLAIDEAHCISEWGHNFRPDYLKLARVAESLRVGRVLALTATATPEVAGDIAKAFGIASADVVRTSFHRPNLELHATPCRADERTDLLLSRLAARPPGPAIVYVTLQRTAEALAETLSGRGLDAAAYHAGLKDEVRHDVQDRFMASPSMIVVATIAFGMGIDKAGIRAVYHYNLPKGPESYAQEIGRAGRDGGPAYCEMFACAEDVTTLENFAYGDTPTAEAIASLLDDVLGRGPAFDVSVYDLSNAHDTRPLVVETLLTYLVLAGVLKATGTSYTEYKIKPHRPVAEILARFDPRRAAFLREVFGKARKGTTWLTLDPEAVGRAIGETSERITKALGYLEGEGEITLQASGFRQGYRIASVAPDVDRLRDVLVDRFHQRESREVARIGRMLEFARADGCITRRLLAYFGEDLGPECGHCGPCLGEVPSARPSTPPRAIGPRERDVVEEARALGHEALATPRQLARFLCGLSSPATTRSRLSKHALFGALADVPFASALALEEGRRSRESASTARGSGGVV